MSGSETAARTRAIGTATTMPATSPPAATNRNSPTAPGNENPLPTAAATATCSRVRAVASFSRPSPSTRVINRGGRPARRPTDSAATGSGGETAAPIAMPTLSGTATTAALSPAPTASAVASTRPTDRLSTVRVFRRSARKLDCSAAAYSSGGMTRLSTISGWRPRLGPGRYP